MLLDQVGELEQQPLSLVGLDRAPRSGEGLARGRHGEVDVLLVAFGDGGEKLAGCRIAALETLPGRCLDPLAIDQHSLERSICEWMADGVERAGSFHVRGFLRCLSI